MRFPFIAGNWKMFKNKKEAKEFASEFKKLYEERDAGTDVKVAIFAPFTQLETLKEAFAGTPVKVGAQNVHFEREGAFTGEISIPMLEELNIDYCLVGHSERRQYFGETDETVNLKLKALLKSDILPLVCVGESLPQREAGKAEEIVGGQIRADFAGISAEDALKITVAYEPIWAIGTGKTATPEQADEMCACIRNVLTGLYGEDTADEVIIQYGGSVKPENAAEIMNMEDIDGALVGGASLEPLKFIEIVNF